MNSRLERLLIALMFALMAAGVTLVVVQAQDGGPAGPAVPAAASTPQTPACVACHTEFATEWENGPHGQAVSDPTFVKEWEAQGKPGACLVCHVTNYDPATGTWQQDGVSCEACHGPMKADHPKAAMPVDRSPDLCARCHSDTRFGWQDWQGSTHYQRGMNCSTCHDPHSASLKFTRALNGNVAYNDASQLCVNCHKDVSMNFPYSVHQKQGVSCINCHVTHTEKSPADAHTVPDHSFKASLGSCNTCHAEQMHAQADADGANPAAAIAASNPHLQQAGLSPAPTPVSPLGYAGLAALVGLAAGMVLAPWLEKLYRRASKRPHGIASPTKMSKRLNRRDFLKLTAVAATAATAARIATTQAAASEQQTSGPHQWVMVIDQSKCIGCGYCTLACQAHNDVNPEIEWNRVEPTGKVSGKDTFLPRPCMQCAKAPCVDVCPVRASYYRSDGIVMMDYDRCIGCRYCEVACPYQARSFNWKQFDGPNPSVPNWGQPEVARRPRGVVEKCAFCYQRIDRGLELGLEPGVDPDATPACAVVCPTGARIFGDANDPNSNVSKALASHATFRLREALGTDPRVYYIPADADVMEG